MSVTFSVLLIGTAIGLIYYWIDFYIKGGVKVVNEEWYVRFQKSFPIADLWTAASALVGAIGLLVEENFGLFFSIIAAGSLIFLGLMDVTFNIQNKLYRLIVSSSQMKFEVFINIWTLGLGIALLIFLWPRLTTIP